MVEWFCGGGDGWGGGVVYDNGRGIVIFLGGPLCPWIATVAQLWLGGWAKPKHAQ